MPFSHVKGKRKAPPPPVKLDVSSFNEKLGINQNENENILPNGKCKTGNAPETTTCFTIQKRKNPAPLPPKVPDATNKEKQSLGGEMNNLSSISKRVGNKSAVKAINLNIFEPNHIRNDLGCLTKENNEVNVNLDVSRRNDTFDFDFRQQRNEQFWICNYCTLQNPFWKIICDACERIKPYNTHTATHLNLSPNADNNLARAHDKHLSTVVMRPKQMNNEIGKILHRNSMNIEARASNCTKEHPNKRNSLCLFKYGDQNISPETLEMEKERIRSVIRAMNNRALAQKYPTIAENKPEIVKSEVHFKTASICKPGKRNGLKYDITKDYNLPSTRRNGINCPTKSHDLKVSTNGIKPILEIGNSDIKAASNYDQMSLVNTQKTLETIANKNDEKHTKPTTAAKNSIRSGLQNEISINVYINFSNAIEVKAQRDMTLNEFKAYIFDMLMPCENPKIYFNGMRLNEGEQSLTNYGVTNLSSLYINTESIAVQAVAKNDKKSMVQKEVPESSKIESNEENIRTAQELEGRTNWKETDGAVGNLADGEKFLIEHVQLNRYTIERVAPRNENMNKTKYRGVYNYNPRCNPDISKLLNQKPVRRVPPSNADQTTKINAEEPKPAAEPAKNESLTQYIELLSLDDSMDLTKNSEIFECSVCFVEYQPLEGVILRNCLHTFCHDCMRNTILFSDEAEVKCPYMDKDYSCDCLLQDREIKAILSKSEYDDHLAKSLRIAENRIENSFHCKTPDCKGWCIFEDDVNIFKCQICCLENCLTCRVIHDGLDCKQYQNMMKNNVDQNPENATTQAMLEDMIKNGEAMNCPACRIVLMKKWGCDWLKCSMCKTEICWITRGYRWGPGGKGDTSAGCKCGVDGFKCHPKCNYCH